MQPLEYGSLQEAAAILTFRKRRNIDLLKVLVQAAAAMGDQDNLKKYYDELLIAADPEIKELRAARTERDKNLLNEEMEKEYLVLGHGSRPSKPNALKKRRVR